MDPSTDPEAAAGSSSEGRVIWVRHGADVARLVLAAVVWLCSAGLALVYPENAQSTSARVVVALGGLPDSVARAIVGMVQVAAVLAPLVAIALVRRGRWRELGLAVGAVAATAVVGVLLDGLLTSSVPKAVIDEAQRPSWVTGSAFPSGSYLAAVAAAATVLAPTLTRSWRHVVWASVGVVAAARVLTAVETPVGIVSCIATGVFVGSLVMVVAKAPLRWPAASVVERALLAAGIGGVTVTATSVQHRHGPTYEVTRGDGQPDLFVKLVGRDERDAELLARAVRAVRVASPDDRRALGATETVEHEALCLVLAERAGVSAPRLVAVGQTEDRAAILVVERLDGTRADELPELSDAVVRGAFEQLATLHRARISHGWPTLHHLVVDDDGGVSFLDLRWATPSATDHLLANDVADLLVSVAAVVGVERAVAAAHRTFGDEPLAAALPLIQPLAVSPESRAAARKDKQLLAAVRTAVQEATGVEAYEMAKLERLSLRKAVMFVGTLVMAMVLLTLLGNAGEIWGALQEVDPRYLPLLAVVSLLGFPAGALSLMGAVNVRLPFLRTTEVMFAQSFLNRFTPANAGGMALRTRFLQHNGVSLLTAASAVGITSAASGVMQVLMALTFFTWAGRDQEGGSFSLPSAQFVAVVIVGVGALLGIAYASTAGRTLLLKGWESLRSAFADLRELGRQPSKLILLFSGAGLSKLVNIVALVVTMMAFGAPVDFPAVGAMYITATTVASAAPTPGGVGAIEAALTAGLAGLGVEVGQAAAIVLVFRLFTYWLPTLPSWFFLARMQRRGDA